MVDTYNYFKLMLLESKPKSLEFRVFVCDFERASLSCFTFPTSLALQEKSHIVCLY